MAKKSTLPKKEKTKQVNEGIKKLKLLVTIVNRSKALYYVDLLEQFEINMQLVIYGNGTADQQMFELLGLVENEKAIILSVIREDNIKEVLETLQDKFDRIKNGKGIAYTIPMKSLIGASIYQFLSNNQMYQKEEKANG